MDAAALHRHFEPYNFLVVPRSIRTWIAPMAKQGHRKDAWRAGVMIGNDFRCCATGERLHPSLMEAHHLWERSVYPFVRWHVLNGRPMRTDLHRKYHRAIRKRGHHATPDNLRAWLESEGLSTPLEGRYLGGWVGRKLKLPSR